MEETRHHRRFIHADDPWDRTQHPPAASVPEGRRQGGGRGGGRHQDAESVGVGAECGEELGVDEVGVFAEGGEGEGGALRRERRMRERGGSLEEGLDCGSGSEGDGREGAEGVRG